MLNHMDHSQVKDMKQILDMTKIDIRFAMDRTMCFASRKWTPRSFEVGKRVQVILIRRFPLMCTLG